MVSPDRAQGGSGMQTQSLFDHCFKHCSDLHPDNTLSRYMHAAYNSKTDSTIRNNIRYIKQK